MMGPQEINQVFAVQAEEHQTQLITAAAIDRFLPPVPVSLGDLRPPLPPFRHEEAPVTRPDLFERFKGEVFFEGSGDFNILCVGGFSATRYPVTELGRVVNLRCGAPTLVSALAAHSSFEEFKDTTFEKWIAQISEQVGRLGNPVGIFYSASSLAAIELERRAPGTFKALVCIGTPLEMNLSLQDRMKFRVVDFLDRKLSFIPAVRDYIDNMLIEMRSDFQNEPKLSRRSPAFRAASARSLLELYRGAQTAREALKKIEVPILYLQGGQDPQVSPSVPRIFKNLYPKDLLTVHVFENDRHGPQLGPRKSQVFRIVVDWIERHTPRRLKIEDYGPAEAPEQSRPGQSRRAG